MKAPPCRGGCGGGAGSGAAAKRSEQAYRDELELGQGVATYENAQEIYALRTYS